MRRLFTVCGAFVSAVALLVGCESLWVNYKVPNPDSCEAPGYGCSVDEVCNPSTRKCEPIATTMLDLSTDGDTIVDAFIPTTCQGTVSYSCSANMFCTQAPLGSPPLLKLHAISESDIWAVSSSRIVHYDGKIWNTIANCGSTAGFADVFAPSNSDVWFIEGRRVLRLQSNTITEIPITLNDPNTKLRALWGVSGKIWLVGTGGTIFQWDGTTFTAQNSGVSSNLNAIWGPDGQNLWAVGDNGTVLRYNGTTWAKENVTATAHLQSVHGASSSSVWVVGANSTLLRWNGSAWVNQVLLPSTNMLSISVDGGNNGWITTQGGELFRGTAGNWMVHYSGLLSRPNNEVWSFGANSAAMVGGNTKAVRSKWNGTTWNDSMDELMPSPRAMVTISVPFAGAAAMGQGIDGNTYSISTDLTNLGSRLQIGSSGWVGLGLWIDPAPTGSRLAWVVGKGGMSYSLTGTTWSPSPTGTTDDLSAVCGTASSAVWAIGTDPTGTNGRAVNWNGLSWSVLTANGLTGNPLYAVACANGQAYAVGKSMVMLGCTSASCTAINTSLIATLASQTAYAIWSTPSASGAGALDIWVAGSGGSIYRYQTVADKATPYPSGTTQTLRNIFGKNHSEFFVTGDAGTVLKWNGTAFSVVKTDTTASLTTGVVLPTGQSVIGGASAGWLHQVQ